MMEKTVDVPKDLPVLLPGRIKDPGMTKMLQMSTEELIGDDWRALGGPVSVSAFNSSI